MSDFITIDSDNDEVEVVNSEPTKMPEPQPSTSKAHQEELEFVETRKPQRLRPISLPSGRDIFSKFLDKCRNAEPSSDMEKAMEKLWSRFNQADERFTTSIPFVELIERSMNKVPEEPYSQMKLISDELKYRKLRVKKSKATASTSANGEANAAADQDIPPKTLEHIRILEKNLEKLHKRIQQLETAEVDFNSSDEENSAYIKLSKYKDRFNETFNKICELRKNNSYLNRPLRNNVKFQGTSITVVNRAIEKFYNDKHEFPDYHDILKLVKLANTMKDLGLSQSEIKSTAEKAFLSFGKMLKKLRQYEDNEVFATYLEDERADPAEEDLNLRKKLEKNKEEYGNKIDEVIDKYVHMQEEEKLEPEDVPSDVESKNDEEEQEEEDGVDIEVEIENEEVGDGEKPIKRGEDAKYYDNIVIEDTSDEDMENDDENDDDVEEGPCEIEVTQDGVVGKPCTVVLKDIRLNDTVWQKYVTEPTAPQSTSSTAEEAYDSPGPSRGKRRFSDTDSSDSSGPPEIKRSRNKNTSLAEAETLVIEEVEDDDDEEQEVEMVEEEPVVVDADADLDTIDVISEKGSCSPRITEITEEEDPLVSSSRRCSRDEEDKGDNDDVEITSYSMLTEPEVIISEVDENAAQDDEAEGDEIINLDNCDDDDDAVTIVNGKSDEEGDSETENTRRGKPPWQRADESKRSRNDGADSKGSEKKPPWLTVTANNVKVTDARTSADDELSDSADSAKTTTTKAVKTDTKDKSKVNLSGVPWALKNIDNVEVSDETADNSEAKDANGKNANEGDEIMIIDEIVKDKTPTKNNEQNADTSEDVIEIEEVENDSSANKAVPYVPINLSQMIREMNFDTCLKNSQTSAPSTSGSSLSKVLNAVSKNGPMFVNNVRQTQRVPMPSVSSVNARLINSKAQQSMALAAAMKQVAASSNRQTTVRHLVPAGGGSRQHVIQQSSAAAAAAAAANRLTNAYQRALSSTFSKNSLSGSTHSGLSQYRQIQPKPIPSMRFGQNNAAANNAMTVMMQRAQTSTQKRHLTTRTTEQQRFSKETNCIVTRKQITTVIEERVMHVGSTRHSSNVATTMATQHRQVTNRREIRVMKGATRSIGASGSGRTAVRNSTDEIITLD